MYYEFSYVPHTCGIQLYAIFTYCLSAHNEIFCRSNVIDRLAATKGASVHVFQNFVPVNRLVGFAMDV